MILVTGGTGFVGSHIVRWLISDQRRVRLLVRDPGRVADDIVAGVETHIGDVRFPETLASAFAGVERVVHLVGIIRESEGATFEMMHAEATQPAPGGQTVPQTPQLLGSLTKSTQIPAHRV